MLLFVGNDPLGRNKMSKLTTSDRKALPTSDFAGPNKSYPIPDKAHAANAKARASQFASPGVKAEVDAKANKMLGKAKSTNKKAPVDPKTLASMKDSLK